MIDLNHLEQYRENNRIEVKMALGGLPQSTYHVLTSKNKINLATGAITQPFAEMVWTTTGGVPQIPTWENRNAAFLYPLLRGRGRPPDFPE